MARFTLQPNEVLTARGWSPRSLKSFEKDCVKAVRGRSSATTTQVLTRDKSNPRAWRGQEDAEWELTVCWWFFCFCFSKQIICFWVSSGLQIVEVIKCKVRQSVFFLYLESVSLQAEAFGAELHDAVGAESVSDFVLTDGWQPESWIHLQLGRRDQDGLVTWVHAVDRKYKKWSRSQYVGVKYSSKHSEDKVLTTFCLTDCVSCYFLGNYSDVSLQTTNTTSVLLWSRGVMISFNNNLMCITIQERYGLTIWYNSMTGNQNSRVLKKNRGKANASFNAVVKEVKHRKSLIHWTTLTFSSRPLFNLCISRSPAASCHYLKRRCWHMSRTSEKELE